MKELLELATRQPFAVITMYIYNNSVMYKIFGINESTMGNISGDIMVKVLASWVY